MTVAWTTPAAVVTALGPSAAPPGDDAQLVAAVDAANAWCYRKRREAGYDDPADDDAPAPSPDIAYGATLYAIALWRERATVDGYPSFTDLAEFTQPGGSMGQVRRLLGIGRAAIDAPPSGDALVARLRARRRLAGWGGF